MSHCPLASLYKHCKRSLLHAVSQIFLGILLTLNSFASNL
jgi:hypothetical protein